MANELPIQVFYDVWRVVRMTAMGLTDSYGFDTEDVAQQVLETLVIASHQGRIPKQPRAWARTVARRMSWRAAERRDREVPIGGVTELAAIVAPGSGDLDDEIAEATVQRQQVLALIRQLPPEAQAVLALRVDGYSDDEIALQLNLPHSLVRIRTSMALRQLRASLVVRMAEQEEMNRAADPRGAGPAPAPARSLLPATEESSTPPPLDDLPPRQKEVLQLSRRGYKPAQIGRLLGLSANTVRVNLHYARKRVQENVERRGTQARQPV